MAELVHVTVDGKKVEALLATPSGSGRHPGVVVAHHKDGLSVFTRDVVDKLAALGCVVLCVDDFHHGKPDDDDMTRLAGLRDSRLARDMAAAIETLKARPDVQPDTLAVLGHCMGGRTAFLAAALFPVFKGAVVYYGGGMFHRNAEPGPTPFDLLKDIKCPVIGFFGDEDKLIPNDEVDRMEAALAAAGVPHEIHRYRGAGHAFSNFTNPGDFRAEADRDSWARTVSFLRDKLRLG